MRDMSKPCKYTPLENGLRELRQKSDHLQLRFSEIETIMESSLPDSAYNSKTWWGNSLSGTRSHKLAWLNAGWQVQDVDLDKKIVQFQAC